MNTAVTWSISPATGLGVITAAGLYTSPATVTASQSVVVTATSVTDNTKSSLATITLLPQASAPAMSPAPAIYGNQQTVAITSATSSASIRYTIDGSTPTASVGTLYSAPVALSANTTIKALAYGSGLADSSVTSASYSFVTATGTARYLYTDASTEGSWQGIYGRDGYNVIGGTTAYPSYVTVTPSGQSQSVWSSSTADVRAPQAAATGNSRVAGSWSGNTFDIDVNINDTKLHQVGLYLLDWDSTSRVETITVLDAATNAILDIRSASSFNNGQYWVWSLSGHLILRLTQTAGANAVVSGLFFDPTGVTVTPAATALSPNQNQQFTSIVTNSSNGAVTWSVNPNLGTVSGSGLYTAPASVATQQTVSVIATSVADPTKSGAATVTLLPGVTGGPMGTVVNILAEALCRQTHAAPTVDAGPDQNIGLSCSGSQCSAGTTVTGAALNYNLEPGFSLTYGWNLLSGPGPVQFASPGSASTTASFPASGVYALQLSVNDGIATSSAVTRVYVYTTGNSNGDLYLSPAVSGPNAVTKPVSIQARWQNSAYGAIGAGALIQVTVTGANPQTATIVTDSSGTATLTYAGANPGTDTIVAGANPGNLAGPITSNTATVTWITAPPKLTSSPVTARFFPADGSGVFNTTTAQTPVFTQVFTGINFDPAAGTVPGNTSGVTNQTRPFTGIVTDRNGSYAGAIVAQGAGYQAGAGPLYSFSGVFTGTLNVPSAGQVAFSVTSDDAFVLGIGNGATRVSGPQVSTPATTAFQNYAVMGGVNQRMAPAPNAITVNFPAAGAYPYELDYAKGGDNRLTLTLQANGAAIPAAALLMLTPASVSSIRAGQIQQLVLSATDANGVVLPNLAVTFTVTGENAQTRLLTTDGVGQAGFAYAGSPLLPGPDTVQAATRVNGADAYSNAVVIPWNNGVNQAPVVSAGSSQTVTLPGAAVLGGSVSDDGMPNNALTITWTMQSGPGAVTFDNASQAVTAATFSIAGTYVLQLSASDGALTGSATVTVTVSPATTWNTGWILNPIDKSTVSGPVPVTLIPGITLVSGTLTYYAANSAGPGTVLSPNTTGTGQIGTFDPTTLNNGSYFIQLNATNSLGATQNNLALVTVTGDYKPGRVTATVTDFVVPAPGLAIRIERVYDSLLRSQSGDFGYGWNLGIKVDLQTNPTDDVVFTIGGQRRTFYFTPATGGVFGSYYSPRYTAEPGLFGSLVTTGDNCSGVLVRVGNIYQCAISNAGQFYQPTGYVYTDPYGRVYTTDGSGNLQSLKDLNNNTLTVTSTGITSSTGLSVPFVRDTQGRITQTTDPLGNVYLYGYNANGELASVTLPPVPGVTAVPITYTYNTGHYLAQAKDARGNTAGSTVYYPNGRLQSITDAIGNTINYAYDTVSNITTVSNPDGGTETTQYDAYGKVLTFTDGLNRPTTYTYNVNHNALTEKNALNKTTTYGYDANGFKNLIKDPLNNAINVVNSAFGGPVSVTNPLNQTQNITYDSNFNVAGITDSIGSVGGYTWGPSGLLLTVQDARGNTSTYQYDQFGNKTVFTDSLGRVTHYVYNTLGQLTSETDPRGNTTSYTWDPFGRMRTKTDALSHTTTYAYDANGNKLSETDANNHATTYVYDAANRLTQVNYPDSASRRYTYDFRGKQLTMTDQLNSITKNIYDKAGQLASTTYAFGTTDAATISYSYDGAGRKLTETDERSNTNTNGYDDAGRLTSVTNAQNKFTIFGYDAAGRRSSMLDANNHLMQYGYDSRGRQTMVTDPNNKITTYTYDGLNLVLTVTDPENRTTTYTYDRASQLTAVTNALNQLTQYGYDLAGNKTSQTDASNHTTTYEFNAVNRRTKRTLPLSMFETYTYDQVGNVATRTSFNGKTTTYGYDSLNRQTSRTPDASLTGQTAIILTHTASGKRKTMTDASGSTTWNYDNRDRVLSKATPQGTLTYTWDPHSNVASVASSNTNGVNVSYSYDTLNRLSGVTDNRLSNQTTYTYDSVDSLASFAYPNGVLHSYSYDAKDQLTGLQVGKVPGTFASYAHTFGDASHKLTVGELNGRMIAYGYDPVYNLLNETISGDAISVNNGSLTYLLDPAGNRQTRTSTLAALAAQSFSFDANDRQASDTYDNNGNTLASGVNTYGYDFEDHLTNFNNGAVTIVYDGDGNRVSETVAGVMTQYLVDDFTPTGYPQVAEEIVGGAVQRRYTHGTMRISQAAGGVTSYYGYDAGGSVRHLTDTTGAVTGIYTYDAFGNLVASTGATQNLYLYRGEQFDPALNLYYLRARWMNPETGRFVTRDPYEGDGTASCCKYFKNLSIVHRYVYASDDPVNQLDPSGLNATSDYALLIGLITLPVAGAAIDYEQKSHAAANFLAAVGAGVFDLQLRAAMWLVYASKPDLKKVRDAGKQVGREPGCRTPTPEDGETVHKILKTMKLGAADHSLTYDDILDVWREVLCGGN